MPGKIITIPVYQMYSYAGGISCTPLVSLLNKDNTYISIFGPSQANILSAFKAQKGINILHLSKPSVNGRGGHGTAPRNTVAVYELA